MYFPSISSEILATVENQPYACGYFYEAEMSELNSVVVSKKADGSWQAHHVPSDRFSFGESPDEAEEEMRKLLGLNEANEFEEPRTSPNFTGLAQRVALFLEGPISKMLESHSGFARLQEFEDGVAGVRLGGGCQGCPASTMTLVNGVLVQLQEEFGEDVITDVSPVA